jgi:hypothetical protein
MIMLSRSVFPLAAKENSPLDHVGVQVLFGYCVMSETWSTLAESC